MIAIKARVIKKFQSLLTGYFQTDKVLTAGLPSVAYCADALNLSANYFGDLVKKVAGPSAQEYIRTKVIEVAYELGFNYPQHFSRMFKQ